MNYDYYLQSRDLGEGADDGRTSKLPLKEGFSVIINSSGGIEKVSLPRLVIVEADIIFL